MTWILLAALAAPASADSFDLANGSTIEGTLATYELGGNCQIFVASGPVRGATLLLPCTEIEGFRRGGAETRAPTAALAAPIPTEEVVAPSPVVMLEPAALAPALPVVEVTEAAGMEEAPIEEEPVAARASLPEGYALPAAMVDAPEAGTDPEASPAAAPTAGPEAAPAEESAPAAAPEGWRQKGQTSSGLPHWLHKALYGDDEPAEGQDT